MPIALGVIVVTYNSADVLSGCLDALVDSTRRAHASLAGPPAVVIVDNASVEPPDVPPRDAIALTVEHLQANLGYARAANRGLARVRDVDAVLFLNPDAQLAPEALTQLLSVLEDRTVALAGPVLTDPRGRPHGFSERPFHSVGRELLHQFTPLARRPFGRGAARTGRARCLTGACLLARRDLLEETGGLDEAIAMYLDDVELCWQAHARGLGVRLVAAARCRHELGGSSEGANFQSSAGLYLTLLAARVEFVRRRRGAPAALAMRWLMAAGEAIRLAYERLRGTGERAPLRKAAVRWALRSGDPPPWKDGPRASFA